MTNAIDTRHDHDIAAADIAEAYSHAADAAAAAYTFAEYRAEKSANTLRNQHAALARFADFLNRKRPGVAAISAEELETNAEAWRGVSWGIVKAWRTAMLAEGYAHGTVNNRLAHIRTYVELAELAGTISSETAAKIRTIDGYSGRKAIEVDKKRALTRVGPKKAAAVALSDAQRAALKTPTDGTGQAIRDALIAALMLDHSMRVGEVAILTVGALDIDHGTIDFYRPKVNVQQHDVLTPDALALARRYMALRPAEAGTDASAPLWVASNRRGRLLGSAMSQSAIAQRVQRLGDAIGAPRLSPHDLRHSWATTAAASGTDVFALRDAGGWATLAQPSRYAARAAVANERVKLSKGSII